MSALDDIVTRRTNRAIAMILSYKEKHCDQYLPEEVQAGLRSVVLDVINDLALFMLDTKELRGEGVVINEVFLSELERLLDQRKAG